MLQNSSNSGSNHSMIVEARAHVTSPRVRSGRRKQGAAMAQLWHRSWVPCKVTCALGNTSTDRRVPQTRATSNVTTAAEQQQARIDRPLYRTTDATIKDIQSLYKSLLHEYDYQVPAAWIEGKIPPELQGTYFRNGPGMQVNNPRYKRHTFDGDGMILSFGFHDGQVWFKNKFVRTKGFMDEQVAGQPVHRTAFTRGAADGSLLFNPFDFTLKNVANTGVIHWGGKLLALYESGLPHQLDPATLDTMGESNLGGQLVTPVLAAHYRVMPGAQQLQQQKCWGSVNDSNGNGSNGNGSVNGHSSINGNHSVNGNGSVSAGGAVPDGRTWVGFSFNTGVGDAELLFYEFAESGSLSVAPVSYKLPGTSVAMIHDIAVTEDYYVVVVGPVNFNPGKFLTQYLTSQCSIAECLMYEPDQPTKVHLVPRPRGAAVGTKPCVMDAPPMFTFHHANAYQLKAADGKQLIVLDSVAWDNVQFEANQYSITPDYYKGGNRAQLRRFVFELDPPQLNNSNGNGNGTSSSSIPYVTGRLIGDHQLARRCVEFPSVNWDVHSRPHRHIYCSADTVDDDLYWGPTQAVMKITLPDPLSGMQQSSVLNPDVNVDMWDAGTRRLVMEPMFVPRPEASAEDDGWIIVTVHNAATGNGELAILDAQDISAGPVAVIHLQHFLPAGLHGSFTSQLWDNLGSNDGLDAGPAWKEPNVVRAI